MFPVLKVCDVVFPAVKVSVMLCVSGCKGECDVVFPALKVCDVVFPAVKGSVMLCVSCWECAIMHSATASPCQECGKARFKMLCNYGVISVVKGKVWCNHPEVHACLNLNYNL